MLRRNQAGRGQPHGLLGLLLTAAAALIDTADAIGIVIGVVHRDLQ